MEVAEHTADLDGQPLFWRSAPSEGTPTLYVHGVPTSSDDWVPFLERTGGLAPDLPGFGRSGKGGHLDYSIEGIATFVDRFLELTETEQINLVVHDWGSAALAWACRNPQRVERLVVINAVPLLDGYRWHRIARIWRRPVIGELVMGWSTRWAMRRLLRPAFAGPVPEEFVRAAWSHFDQGTQRAILRLYRSAPEQRLAQHRTCLSHISAPTWVVWGAHDPYIPLHFGDAYAEVLGNVRVEHLRDAGHWPWIDRGDLVDRIAEFLRER